MLISGRAGIGKSRLVAELSRQARSRGVTVLSGRCIQLVGLGLPYLPFADALRPVSRSPALAALAGQLQELPRLIPDLADSGTLEPAGADRTESRLRLFQEVFRVLEQLSAEQPVVVALEDLHWADASTLDLLAFLAHGVGRARVLLLGTYRTEEVGLGEPLQRLVSAAVSARAAVSLELEPLGRDDVEALVRAGSETRPPEALVDPIFARSEGIRSSRTSCSRPRPAATRRFRPSCGTCCWRTSPAWTRAVARSSVWRPRRDGTHPTNCSRRCHRWTSLRSPRRCGRRSSTTCSCRTRRRERSVSATRCSRRPSATRSSPASARCCTSASPVRSRRSHGSR